MKSSITSNVKRLNQIRDGALVFVFKYMYILYGQKWHKCSIRKSYSNILYLFLWNIEPSTNCRIIWISKRIMQWARQCKYKYWSSVMRIESTKENITCMFICNSTILLMSIITLSIGIYEKSDIEHFNNNAVSMSLRRSLDCRRYQPAAVSMKMRAERNEPRALAEMVISTSDKTATPAKQRYCCLTSHANVEQE